MTPWTLFLMLVLLVVLRKLRSRLVETRQWSSLRALESRRTAAAAFASKRERAGFASVGRSMYPRSAVPRIATESGFAPSQGRAPVVQASPLGSDRFEVKTRGRPPGVPASLGP